MLLRIQDTSTDITYSRCMTTVLFFLSHLFSAAFDASGVALWEASFVLAEWLSRHGDEAGGLTNCQAYQDNLQGYGLQDG